MLDGAFMLSIRFWIDFKSAGFNVLFGSQTFFTICLAVPKNKLCMGSIIVHLIQSKYSNCISSV